MYTYCKYLLFHLCMIIGSGHYIAPNSPLSWRQPSIFDCARSPGFLKDERSKIYIKFLIFNGAATTRYHCSGWWPLYITRDRTPLHIAVERGNYPFARLLLENITIDKEACINATDEQGRTALHWAAMRGYIRLLKLLIHHQANVNAPDKDGKTALHWAASKCLHVLVKVLLDHQANIDSLDHEGNTLMHHALSKPICSWDIPAIGMLLDHGANLHKANRHRETPLKRAVKFPLLISFLAQRELHNEKDENGKSLLHYAAHYAAHGPQYVESVKILCKNRADILSDSYARTPVAYAISAKSKQALSILLAYGVPIAEFERSAMSQCLSNWQDYAQELKELIDSRRNTVRILLQANSDPSVLGNDALELIIDFATTPKWQ